MDKKDKKEKKISFFQIIKRIPKIYRFMKKYKWLVFVVFSLTILRVLLVSIPPLLIKYTVDSVIPLKAISSLNIIFGFVLLIYVTEAGIRVANIYIRRYLGANVNYDIRKELFDALLIQSPRFFSKRVTGEITSRLNNDAGSVEYLASNAIFDLTNAFLSIFFSLCFLFYLSWQMTLIILGLTFSMYILVTINMFMFKKYRKRISEKWGRLLGFLQETISNIKIVVAFGAENKTISTHTKKSREYIKDNIKFGIVDRFFDIIGTLFYYVFQLGVILYGVYLISKGEVSLGLLLAFLMYVNNFFGPIFGLSGTLTFAVSSFVSVDRIYEYIEEKNEVTMAKKPISFDKSKGCISFEDVVFGYDKDKDIVKGISFDIKEGENIAFVGHSGAGKSTLISLILRFYDPKSGKIKINGTNLKDIDILEYREMISIVFQDSLLFNDTIWNNLKYSKQNATDEEVDRACKDANIYDFIMDLPKKYETVVGERGLKLSGGQRQRLSIARSVLKNPKILILDEATASIDSISENIIQKALDNIMKGRTSIVIAHRLSTIVNSDKIIVLDDGKIVEVGTHNQLLAKKSHYYELWTAQMKKK